MNGKQYVGRNASTFESYKPNSPVTGVRLLVDDENEYVAGDTEGNVWELTCPYGTQAMANNILASLSGKIYKGFEADNAVLTPSAELGDGVTVNGLYTMLAYRKVEFGPGHMSTIAAPGDNEPDEEYKYTPRKDRDVNRKLAQTRSLITKSAEEIRLAIEATDGRVSELKVTLDGVTITDGSGTTRIKGSSIDTGSIAAGSIRADQVNLTGSIKFGDLNSEVQGDINSAISDASSAKSIAEQIAEGTYRGGSFIDEKNIYGPNIYTNNLNIYPEDPNRFVGGTFNLYGGYNGRNLNMFRIQYATMPDVFVRFDSPDGAGLSMGFKNVYFEGSNQSVLFNCTVNFSGAKVNFSDTTVTGLTAVFG